MLPGSQCLAIWTISMIKGYRLHIKKGKLCLVLLEYGEQEITFEDIERDVDFTQVGYFNSDEVKGAVAAGVKAELEIAEPPPDEIKGTCWVELDEEDGSIKAHVYPPIGPGKVFNESDIRRELELAGFEDYYYFNDIIRRNLESHRKSKTPVVFRAAEKRDADIKIEISSDRRTAYMTYHRPWGGSGVTLEEALQIIASQDVRFGVDEDRVQEIINANTDVDKQRIAGAKEPEKGEDAVLEYLFDAFHKLSGPKISDTTDCADYRDLNLLQNVVADTPLAQRIPFTPGEDGMDVMGNEITAESGKDIPMPKGKNTGIAPDDPNLLISLVAGTPKLVNSKVIVEEVCIVYDVDFSTGNIEFNGDVVVKGTVHPGFSVTANGDITVKDTIEACNLSAKGNIFLKRGLKGMNKSYIKAGDCVYARFIENSTVFANESVIVDEAIIHSTVFANQTVEVTHPKGSIFGGEVKARTMIRAAFIGSEMAVKTELEVGVAPKLKEQLEEFKLKIVTKKKDLDKAAKNLTVLNAQQATTGLSVEREELYQELGNVTLQLKDEIEEISQNIADLENNLQECAEGSVEAKNTMHPGVVITIKTAKKRIGEPVTKAKFIKEGPDIVLAVDLPEDEDPD